MKTKNKTKLLRAIGVFNVCTLPIWGIFVITKWDWLIQVLSPSIGISFAFSIAIAMGIITVRE